ncbi:hypothetical protein FACS189456_2700 [Bacteroidia bacterium]|nr:hypothetical protein FACS189456_2700 [Bacteroidia bacterium]
MKKLCILTVALLMGVSAANAQKWECGENVTAELKDTTLTISGKGAMKNYNTPPWYSYKSKITSVVIEQGVTSIGSVTFANCRELTSVSIGNSVTYIGYAAFYGCSRLTSITIPNAITSIDNYTFYGCTGLTSVTIPNSVTYIGYAAFYGCRGLTSITIPNSVTSIGYAAFEGCRGLMSVTIGNSVTSIGDDAFEDCRGLTSVTIPNSVTSIGDGAFEGCRGLKKLTIEDGKTALSLASNFDSIETLYLGRNTKYRSLSLSFGKVLKQVIIGNSVTSIGDGAFSGCSGLSSVTLHCLIPPNNRNPFGNEVPIHIPVSAYDAYKNSDGWKDANLLVTK